MPDVRTSIPVIVVHHLPLIPTGDVAGKYREFHKLYKESEFVLAGELLLSLLQARLAPKQ